MYITLPLISILLCLLFIGLCMGIEIAFVSANKLSVEINKKQGSYSGKIWGGLAEQPTKFVGAMLMAITLLYTIYGLFIGKLLLPLWKAIERLVPTAAAKYLSLIQLLVDTIAAAIIILFVTIVFKSLFKAKNNIILTNSFFAYVAKLFYNLFSSISTGFISIAEWILKFVFNVKVRSKKELFSKIDLANFVQQNKMHNEEDQADINKVLFENALSLSDIKLRDCLVPRKEIIGISNNSSMEATKLKFVETQLSKLVVYDSNIDTIVGYLHQLDLFKNPTTLAEILLPIPTVPETMNATNLLAKFSKERKSIAWVIDEFGGTAGIVTMEDLLEEVFGEIKDEHDDIEEFVDKQLSENEYLFSGRMELDAIALKYNLHFLEDETAETLSGYIIQHNQNLPKQKQQIIIGNYEFSITSMSETKIETVKLKVLRNQH